MTVTLVIPSSLHSPRQAPVSTHIVAAPGRRRASLGVLRRRMHDECVEFLAAQKGEVVVLAPTSDARLREAARQLGISVVTLPEEPSAARWSVAVAGHVERCDRSILRVVDVVAAGPDAWGPDRGDCTSQVPLTTLRPATIARLASRLWSACTHCTHGGRISTRCAGCGMRLAAGGLA